MFHNLQLLRHSPWSSERKNGFPARDGWFGPKPMRTPPVRHCARCQGVWFRKTPWIRFPWRDLIPETYRPALPSIPRAFPALVCLCGFPSPPNLSGVRPPAEDRRTEDFLDASRRARELQPETVLPRLAAAWRDRHGSLSPLQELQRRLDAVQDELTRFCFHHQIGNCDFGRRRDRGKSSRAARSKGRDSIVVDLQSIGVPARKAKQAVGATSPLLKICVM